MALDYNYIDSYIKDVYIPKMVDNILDSNPVVMRLLRKAKKQVGGRYIFQPVWYAKNTSGGSYGRWDVASINYEEKTTLAKFDWRYVRKFITLDNIDVLENSGAGEVVDILDTELMIAKQSFKDDLGTMIFSDGTGNSNKDMLGLKAAIDDGTLVDTYGSITRSTDTFWKANVDLNGSTDRALTIKLMQSMMGDCRVGVDSGDSPTLLVTTQAIFEKACEILDATRVRDDSDIGKAGFEQIYFLGKPLTVDSHCDTGYLYFINENHVRGVVNPNEFFKYVPFAKRVDQESMVAKIRLAANLICDECRKSGVIRYIDADL